MQIVASGSNGSGEKEEGLTKLKVLEGEGTISSDSPSSKIYDVFISFRGEDTRRNFTSHLYSALCRAAIKTYKDDRTLDKGDEIWPAIVRAINESYLCVVVFSKGYADSTWCLRELAQILECKEEGQIIPVFYQIEPSHIRHQTGSYMGAFDRHAKDSKLDEATLNKWKASLQKAANFSGWDSESKDHGDESKLVENIVGDVLQKLDHRYPSNELRGLVGILKNTSYIEFLLREVQAIGIWGMGGIGKTAIAKVVFDKLSPHYDGCCFLANVREQSEKFGLHYLRDHLLSELLVEDLQISTPKVRTSFAISRLTRRKVFIVLDDVNSLEQLEYLIGEYDCLGPDSRVIVTSRDKQILISKGFKTIHKVNELNPEESLKLFSMNAFDKNNPEIGFEKLAEKAVAYAGGVPLALKVLGSSLCSKTIEIWESALRRLEKYPDVKIQNVLRLSYDGLGCLEKEIFLDIACFFQGECKNNVMMLLEACGFYADVGIEALLDKALVTIEFLRIQMHDLIREMGRAIVREKFVNEPEKHSRLWDSKEVYHVLNYNKGTHFIEGIVSDLSNSRDLHLSADAFRKMTKLRFLKFYTKDESLCKVCIPSGLKSISNELRYLRWDECPLESLPSTFCAVKLVEFRMPNSQVKKLWDGVQDLVNLKLIDLTGSQQLMELPDFSKARKLEGIYLSDCPSLCHVHPSLLSLHMVVELMLFKCVGLQSLQSETHLRSLQHLDVGGCSSLKEFSLFSEEIRVLDLSDTKIERLFSSIGRCSNLEQLCLGDSIKNLPNEFSNLRSLEVLEIRDCRKLDNWNLHIILDGLQSLRVLNLRQCPKLSQFPASISVFSSLCELRLDGSNIESLPASISDLSSLRSLSISNCRRLRSLLYFPRYIELVMARNCTSLKTVITSTLYPQESSFIFANCMELDAYSFSNITRHALDILLQNRQTCRFCLPGKMIPKFFSPRMSRPTLTIELFERFHLLGFAFCVILSHEHLLNEGEGKYNFTVRYKCYLGNREIMESKSGFRCSTKTKLASDHVYLWYEDLASEAILKGIKYCKANDEKLSFEFFVKNDEWGTKIDHAIKECGVWAITKEEWNRQISEMNLRKAEAWGDIDAEQLLNASTMELNKYQHNWLRMLQSDDSSDDDSVNQMDNNTKRPLEADEQQLPLIKKKFKQSILQPLPRGSKLELDTEGVEGGDSNYQNSNFQESIELLTSIEGWETD